MWTSAPTGFQEDFPAMRTAKDVEAYLLRLNRKFEEAEGTGAKGGGGDEGPRTFLVHVSDGMPPIALRVDPPLAVFRVHIGDIAKEPDGKLLRRLLELNAKGLLHASYGLDGERIVLGAALELENLDLNEFEATMDEMELALAQQVPVLAELAGASSSTPGSSGRR